MMLPVLLSVSALAVEVCPSEDDCLNDDDCACTLEQALAEGHERIDLRPGTHRVLGTLFVAHPIELTGAPGARLLPQTFASEIRLTPYAAGSRLEGLVLEGGPALSMGLTVRASGVEVRDLVLEHRGTSLPLLMVEGAEDVRIEELVVRGLEAPEAFPPCSTNGSFLNGSVWVPLVLLTESEVEIRGASFENNRVCVESAVEMAGGKVRLEDVRFQDLPSSVFWERQFLGAFGTQLSLEGLSFAQDLSSLQGAQGRTLLRQWSGTLEASRLSASASRRLQAPALELIGTTSVRLTDTALPPDHHRISIHATPEVTLERLQLTEGAQRGQTPLVLSGVTRAAIRESWFCGPGARDNGGAIALVESSCTEGCVIEDSVFVDARAGGDGGAILLEGGELLLQRSTFRGSAAQGAGAVMLAASGPQGQRAQVEVRQTLFAETGSGRAALVGGQLSLQDVASDAPLVDGGWQGAETVLEGVSPVWLEEQPGACGRSVLLAESPLNDWLVQRRVGALVPCWQDLDGDGWGGLYVPDGPRRCADEGMVSQGGDCDDADPAWNVQSDCADADGDGVRSADDCDDRDPELGRCAMRWSGGCALAGARGQGGASSAWLALAAGLLGGCRFRRGPRPGGGELR